MTANEQKLRAHQRHRRRWNRTTDVVIFSAMKLLRLYLGLLCATVPVGAQATVTVSNLRCEYRENPLGLDTTQPRFGWQLTSDHRAEFQTAYQILAASSSAKLAHGDADVWDSGKVASGESVYVVYAGRPCELPVVFRNRLNDVLRNNWIKKTPCFLTSIAFLQGN